MTNTKKSSKVIELPMLGSLNKVTDYIPCLNLVGAVGYNQAAYDEAAKLVKQPLKYLRQTLCLGECAIVWTGDRYLRGYTRVVLLPYWTLQTTLSTICTRHISNL